MTKQERDKIEERCDTATPGEWYKEEISRLSARVCHSPIVHKYDVICDLMTHADADFVAHARQDIPRLLDALKKAEAETKRADKWERRAKGWEETADSIQESHEITLDVAREAIADRDHWKARAEALEQMLRQTAECDDCLNHREGICDLDDCECNEHCIFDYERFEKGE